MKFNKLLIGLAATPLLLASCSNALSYSAAKQWVTNNYKQGEPKSAVAVVSWDYHASTEGLAKSHSIAIYQAISDEAVTEGISNIIPPDIANSTTGQRVHVEEPKTVKQLNGNNFSEIFSEDETDNIYKVNNGSFSATYKHSMGYTYNSETYTVPTTRILVYNTKGYCVDFGLKVNSERIEKEKPDTIKLKFYIHFVYEDDPIE